MVSPFLVMSFVFSFTSLISVASDSRLKFRFCVVFLMDLSTGFWLKALIFRSTFGSGEVKVTLYSPFEFEMEKAIIASFPCSSMVTLALGTG